MLNGLELKRDMQAILVGTNQAKVTGSDEAAHRPQLYSLGSIPIPPRRCLRKRLRRRKKEGRIRWPRQRQGEAIGFSYLSVRSRHRHLADALF
jgi:hypothetical protein